MIGQAVSHYRILAKLGEGGMGVVYKAEDIKLKRTVALKFLPPELTRDKGAKTRFIHEAQAASALQHHNICTIHEIDETKDGRVFISMDCYEGETLKQKISKGPLPLDETIKTISQVAEGLGEAHKAGMVHRDIKPANIMVTAKGVVKILDFGLAKLAGQTKLTKTGTTVGTVAYMSPEQAKGEELESRSDIWSLGVVLYEVLTGVSPFKGDHEAAVMYGIMHTDPQPVTGLRSGIPIEVDRIIDKCLAKDRAERYQTAADLLADLRRLQREMSSGITRARTGVSREESRKTHRRWLWGIPFVVLVAVLVVYKFLSPTDETPGRDERTAPPRPNWILVSDFVGPKDDPDLAAGVRELVVSSLTQSGIVTPLSRSDLKRGLGLAMKPDTTRIEGEVARELAYRAAARVYIEGRVDRIASGYSIVLHVNNAETGSFVSSVQGMAKTGDEVIVTLDRITRELREKLGESPDEVAATRPAGDVMTPSFAAYQKYVRGTECHNKGDNFGAREQAREALRLDPDFVNAWTLLGWTFLVEGLEDSARYAYDEALHRPNRQTEENYLATKAMVSAFLDYELTDALEQYNRLNRLNPGFYDNNRGAVLTRLGREEEALEMSMDAMKNSPFGPTSSVYTNVVEDLIMLGRYDEARQLIPDIPYGIPRNRREVYLALALSEWVRSDSIITHGVLGSKCPLYREMVLASLEASRGSVRAAVGRSAPALERLEDVKTDDDYHFCSWVIHLLASTGMDEMLSLTPACSDTTVPGLILRGVQNAWAGDTRAAVGALDAIRQRPDHLQRKHKSDIAVLEASISAANGEWEKVVRALTPLTQGGQWPVIINRLPIRWLVAEAYEKQGQIEQAAEAFELVISPVLIFWTELYVRPSYVSLAHYRLVLIYSQLGRLDEARRNLMAFETMFTDPDPELAPMLEEARSVVAKLEGGL